MKRYDAFNPKHILCPADFSELSDLSLRYAAVGARELNARLTILHAEPFELPRYFSQSQSDQFLKELSAIKKRVESDLVDHVNQVLQGFMGHLNPEYVIVDRQPAEAILDTADKEGADLMILGTHGYGGIKRFFLGSVAQRVVENAKTPVFLVRQKESEFIDVAQPEAIPRLERILCPCNATSAAEMNLKYAGSLAHRFNSRLTVLHIQEHDEEIKPVTIQEDMEKWAMDANKNNFPFETVIRKGLAAEQIIGYARENREDLIVLAAHYQSFGQGTYFGKTTDLVIRHAPVPVLVTPYFN